MIIAFGDDTTVSVWQALEDIQREYEGIDVEGESFSFYSDDGVRLEPVFLRPNRRGRILGFIPWIESGVFTLEPRPERTDRPIWRAFAEHPNPGQIGPFRSVAALRAHVATRGAMVEPASPGPPARTDDDGRNRIGRKSDL